MQLFLEPVDVWLFRDGRPFDAQSDHRAESLFPPYPTVLQGAVRSHHLVVKGVDLADKQAIAATVGTATDYKHLRLRGPFVAKRQEGEIIRYFPVPADAVLRDKQAESLRPTSRPRGVVTSTPTPMLLLAEGQPHKGGVGDWLDEASLHRHLAGRTVPTVASQELFAREIRPGIGRDDTRRTTRQGFLYEVEFIRPCWGVGLWVEVQGLDGWPERGLMRIGGEGRSGYFSQCQDAPWPSLPDPLPARFKVYFATPTYFERGWQPEDWGKFFDGRVALQAAALRRYESVGGFDLAENPKSPRAHRPARRYVPAGSVYYFQCDGRVRLKPGLPLNGVSDFGAEIGFGQILVKEWYDV